MTSVQAFQKEQKVQLKKRILLQKIRGGQNLVKYLRDTGHMTVACAAGSSLSVHLLIKLKGEKAPKKKSSL